MKAFPSSDFEVALDANTDFKYLFLSESVVDDCISNNSVTVYLFDLIPC